MGMFKAHHIPGLSALEASEMTGIGLETLSRLRQLKLGPPCYCYDGEPHYDFDSMVKWLQEQEAILKSIYGVFSKVLLNKEMAKIAWHRNYCL